jgi:pimeloyl-ACP methyl ester carboxylesterase
LDKDALICWPMKDIAFPDEALGQWRRRFPDAQVHEIVDAGHFVQEDAHERLIPWIIDFVRKTS